MTRTMTTSKGHTFTTDLTDDQAARIVAVGDSAFGRDLAAAYGRGRLSAAQRPWLHKLALDMQAPAAPAPVSAVDAFATQIVALMDGAVASGLRRPRVTVDLTDSRFEAPGHARITLAVAGAASRYAGQVMVTDGRPYGSSTFYGRIDREGRYFASRAAPGWVEAALREMALDPAAFTAAVGRRTGNCCFCARELSTTESLAVGYGPICAGHYGLPWGRSA
jgi:hypothetical protein